MRCANTEALNRHMKEVDEAETVHENNCKEMYEELDEALQTIEAIAKKYDLKDEAKEYIEDKI